MKAWLLVLIVLQINVWIVMTTRITKDGHRDKRAETPSKEELIDILKGSQTSKNAVQFANMVRCTTGWAYTDLRDYGCYCGPGGQGTPKDAIDKCCQAHDTCWGNVQTGSCTRYLGIGFKDPYYVSYTYQCQPGSPPKISCSDALGSCARETCECDRTFVFCILGKKINPKFKNLEPYDTHCPIL